MILELSLLVLCVLGSAVSSGSETALVSASRLRLQHLGTEHRHAAAAALGLLDRREQILVATLVVTNVLNIAGAAIATDALERLVGSMGSVLATVVMTSIFLVLSEITPKAYFRYNPERMLMLFGAWWRVLAVVVFPIIYPIRLVLGRLSRRSPSGVFGSKDEIKLVLEESAEVGRLGAHEQEMLESTLDYAETTAREVTVPIAEVVMLDENGSTEAFLELVREHGYTRVPIYRERVDQIVGLANVYDVLYDDDRKSFIRSYMRPARLVPETKPLGELFLELQRERESLAVVVNEFGACIGILSIEDMIEEIFGELSDEHEDSTPEIRPLGPGHYRVSARSDIDDLNEETGWELPQAGFQTVAGYVLYRMGRIPRRGEKFEDGDLEVRIIDVDRYTVKMVEFRKKSADPDPGTQT